VKVTLNRGVDHKVSVGWYTESGTARAWKDFVPAGGRVYFNKWQKVAYIKVLVKDDFTRRWMHRDRCALPQAGALQPGTSGWQPRQDRYRDNDGRHFDHEFFMVKLVHPYGAGIAEAIGVVKIISKDFRHGRPHHDRSCSGCWWRRDDRLISPRQEGPGPLAWTGPFPAC
jgi:hypothetical protein